MVQPIPDGFRTVTPHLVVDDGAAALEFYSKAFGAEEICRMAAPDGKIMHAEIRIGDSPIMLCDDFGEMAGGVRAPSALKGCTSVVHLYVQDVDAVFEQAIQAGGKAVMPPMDAFWGDRYGKLQCPFGHHWGVATHKEDLTPEEIDTRAAQMFGGDGSCGAD